MISMKQIRKESSGLWTRPDHGPDHGPDYGQGRVMGKD